MSVDDLAKPRMSPERIDQLMVQARIVRSETLRAGAMIFVKKIKKAVTTMHEIVANYFINFRGVRSAIVDVLSPQVGGHIR